MSRITTNDLRATWHGKDRWLTDGGSRGAGRLRARITNAGVHFFYQYFNGRKRLFPMGPFDLQGKLGLTLAQARAEYSKLSVLYQGGVVDIHGHFEEERGRQARVSKAAREAASRALKEQQDAAAKAAKAEEEAAALAHASAQQRSLRRFLAAYVEQLQRSGRQSAKDVANVFKNHVLGDAKAADSEASLVSTDEFVCLIGKV